MDVNIKLAATLLTLGLLASAPVNASNPSKPEACTPIWPLRVVQDAGVDTLSMKPKRTYCQVDVVAVDLRARRRQETVLTAMTQAACGAPPEIAYGKNGAPTLRARTPKACARSGDQALFDEDPAMWTPPRSMAPRYPPKAVQEEMTGTTWLVLLVDAQGAVAGVIVRTSSGHGLLDDASVAAAKTWRFTRTDPDKVPAAFTLMRVPLTYVL